MVSNPFVLLGVNLAVALTVMVVLWTFTARRGDATSVDVAWAYNLGVLAVLDAVLADGWIGHRLLVAAIVVTWSARLGTHLLVGRVLHSDGEDGRYATLRERWGDAADRKFLVFYAAQAGFDLVFSIAFVLAMLNGDERLTEVAVVGAVVAAASVVGEGIADRQLARWKADPSNRGITCRAGLWGWSRHPNYFFESTTWIGVALIALAAPWGWLAFVTPAFLLVLLFTVTGIPATEAQSLKSRPEDYRRYQEETSMFVPLPPRRGRRAHGAA
jgi:steroid 5-alpha reductase family enzyme